MASEGWRARTALQVQLLHGGGGGQSLGPGSRIKLPQERRVISGLTFEGRL